MKATQRDTVLKALRDAGEQGVHSFEFLTLGIPWAAARVLELRESGHTITSTRERLNGEVEGVRYRLIAPPVPLVPESDEVLNERFEHLFPLPQKRVWGDVA